MKAIIIAYFLIFSALSKDLECSYNELRDCFTDLINAASACTPSLELLGSKMIDGKGCIKT